MAKKFICVEVGDRLVKVAVCLGTEKKRKVKSAFFFETPEGTVQDGAVMDVPKFAEELSRQLEGNDGGDAKEIIFTVSSSKVATREVKMPLLSDVKISGVVENNRTEYFPLDISGYEVLFRVMKREKKGDQKGCTVLVIAMPESIVEACSQVSTTLKMRLLSVDAACNSMVDGMIMLKQSQITAYVHVECTNTNISFMRGSELMLQRSLSFGGDEMISAYQEAGGGATPYLQALQELTSFGAEDHVRGKLTNDDISTLLERVVGSISRSVDFFNSNKGGGIQQIVLMGPCAGILGLEELLEHSSGVPTVQMAQLSTATALRTFSLQAAYFMTCVQAGAHGVNFGKAYDPKKQKGKRAAKQQGLDLPTAILLFILMMIGAVYWGYSAILERDDLNKQLEQLNKEITDMAYLDAIAATHESYQNSRTSLLDFTANTENPNENLLDFLAELEAKMPSEILILTAGCSQTAVTMSIITNSLPEAATVIAKLRTFESIQLVQVSGIGLSWVEYDGEGYTPEMLSGFEEVAFSVVCTYGDNPYTLGWNPYAADLGIENPPLVPDGTVDTPEGTVETPEAEVAPEAEAEPAA